MKYRPQAPTKLTDFVLANDGGDCAECQGELFAGDAVAYYENELCHLACAEDLVALE